MSVLEIITATALVNLAVSGLLFLVAYGLPWRYPDRIMSWHLVSIAMVAILEAIGWILVMWLGLIPVAIAYWASAAIMYWRVGLLIATRRRERDRKIP